MFTSHHNSTLIYRDKCKPNVNSSFLPQHPPKKGFIFLRIQVNKSGGKSNLIKTSNDMNNSPSILEHLFPK